MQASCGVSAYFCFKCSLKKTQSYCFMWYVPLILLMRFAPSYYIFELRLVSLYQHETFAVLVQLSKKINHSYWVTGFRGTAVLSCGHQHCISQDISRLSAVLGRVVRLCSILSFHYFFYPLSILFPHLFLTVPVPLSLPLIPLSIILVPWPFVSSFRGSSESSNNKSWLCVKCGKSIEQKPEKR